VLKEQLRANPANTALLPQANAAIDAHTAGRLVAADQLDPSLAGLFPDAVQGFLISAFALDPADLISEIKLPALRAQSGEEDGLDTGLNRSVMPTSRPLLAP
jgi:hypothetical protein